MSAEIEKDTEDKVGGYLNFTYPKLPKDIDFEVFRRTDEDWTKMVAWYNGAKSGTSNAQGSKHRKERFVLLQWPRDPSGPAMKVTPRGKDTGNGCELWGATLYDFYRVHRIPSCPNLSTISTGSKLAAWMREIGELDAAPNQLKQADLEEDPYQVYPFDAGVFIETIEEQVCKGKTGKPFDVDRNPEKMDKSFDSTHPHGIYPLHTYPEPWPLKPFSTPTIRYQKNIPISYLPRKLIVHDPWKVLEARGSSDLEFEPHELKWGSRPDILRTYHLHLSGEAKAKQRTVHIGPRPEGYETCPVAHLYITPKRRIGRGNHSFVYQTELELPRDMLVEPKMCFQCCGEKFKAAKKKEEEMKAKDPKGYLKMQEEEAEDDGDVRQYYSLLFKNNAPFEVLDRADPRFAALKFMNVQHRPPFCKHLDRGLRAPPSQKVSVTAKLSIPNSYSGSHEGHLRQEAYNYMRFPDHMYEHWSGYNVIQPCHDPTPVGAVVPQFYGYYTPDPDNEPKKNGRYMSAILLLEHCGVQIDPTQLNMDQRQECFSLLRRLHYAGFKHNSAFERNILMQYGPLQQSPVQRSKEHLRFRLIDFGRTVPPGEGTEFREFSHEFSIANETLRLQYF